MYTYVERNQYFLPSQISLFCGVKYQSQSWSFTHHETIQTSMYLYTTTVCTHIHCLPKEPLTNKIGSGAPWHQVWDSARRRVCHQPQATFLGAQPSMMTSEGMFRSITSPRPSCNAQKSQLRRDDSTTMLQIPNTTPNLK